MIMFRKLTAAVVAAGLVFSLMVPVEGTAAETGEMTMSEMITVQDKPLTKEDYLIHLKAGSFDLTELETHPVWGPYLPGDHISKTHYFVQPVSDAVNERFLDTLEELGVQMLSVVQGSRVPVYRVVADTGQITSLKSSEWTRAVVPVHPVIKLERTFYDANFEIHKQIDRKDSVDVAILVSGSKSSLLEKLKQTGISEIPKAASSASKLVVKMPLSELLNVAALNEVSFIERYFPVTIAVPPSQLNRSKIQTSPQPALQPKTTPKPVLQKITPLPTRKPTPKPVVKKTVKQTTAPKPAVKTAPVKK